MITIAHTDMIMAKGSSTYRMRRAKRLLDSAFELLLTPVISVSHP